MIGWLLIVALFLVTASALAGTPRNPATVREFRQTHACPATGKTTGPCKGWVVDHIRPLCFGGADAVDNMQWQAYAESLKKDAFERDACLLKNRCAR